MKQQREYDLVLWGATSFIGKIIARYLLHRLASEKGMRWAMAARSSAKLEELKQELGEQGRDIPLFVGDAFDSTFLREMAAKTKVVLTTVGPYLRYGETLVEACALEGTDYCDLTGEIPFICSVMDKYQTEAEKSGARIVNCTGFDSLPSDLGVLCLQDFAQKNYGQPLKEVEMQVRSAKGGVSGGTVASLSETMAQISKNPQLAKVLQDPYAICPMGQRDGVEQPNSFGARRSRFTDDWLHQFIMAGVNTKIVHSSNARLGYPYGKNFIYSEWQVAKNPIFAYLSEFAIGATMLVMFFPWTRALLTKYVLPKSGQGPSPEAQKNGHFKLVFHGQNHQGQRMKAEVTGDADPGYGSSSKQISEVAIALANTFASRPNEGGFGTPASVLGLSLLPALEQYAGLTFRAQSE